MNYALVTGAAKGIGRAIAKELAKRNYHLLLVDIDQDTLEQTATHIEDTHKVFVNVLALDLSLPESAAQLKLWSAPYSNRLKVVVNNAGYGLNGSFEDMQLDEQLNIIDLNIKAQVTISYAFIPILRRASVSYLLNVGSTTAYQSVPYLNVYAASKAFVVSFTRGLRQELKGSSVSVSCLSPGSTDTDFVVRARMKPHTLKIAEKFNMTPERVAVIAVNGMFRGKAEIIPGFTNKLNAFLPSFFPKSMTERIAADIYRPRESEPTVSNEVLT